MSGFHRIFIAMNLVGLSIVGFATSARAESVDLVDEQLADQQLGLRSEPEAVSTSASLLTQPSSDSSAPLTVQVENMASEQPVTSVALDAEVTPSLTLDEMAGDATRGTASETATFTPLSPTSVSSTPSEPTLQAQISNDSEMGDGSEQTPEPTLNNPVIQDDTPEPIFDDEPSSIEAEIELDDEEVDDDPVFGEDAETDPLDPDTSEFSPGRATRSGPSYIGIGGNLGLGDGDTALGEGSFAVFSKVGITSNLSLRPAALISDNPTILLPVTIDFIPLVTDATEQVSSELGVQVSPFIGAGAAISTGDDSSVDFLATGGVDIGITDRITGLISVSASLFDNPAVGLMLGVGYNF